MAVEIQSDDRSVSAHAAATEVGPSCDPLDAAKSLSGIVRMLAWMEQHALLIVAVAAVAVLSFAGIPAHLTQDGWLALVAGRLIAQHGVPHHDYLTVMAHGVRWVDQQWLAQLAIYDLQRLGGLALFTVAYVLLTAAAFALAVTAGMRLGAQQRHVIWVLPLGAFFYLETAVSIRTQGFAYPLFVAVLWLIASEVRRPGGNRVWFVLPVLVLWANLHGSVTLGIGMAVLYGLLLLAHGFRRQSWSGLLNGRGLAFIVGAPASLFLTPYGLAVATYYHKTLLNPGFGKLISEWQPVTAFAILAIPLLLLIVATVWLLGRSGRRTPAFDQIVLVVLALGAIDAVRNITWFGLALVILLPSTISRLRTEQPAPQRRRRIDLTLAIGSCVLVILGLVVTLGRSASWFESTYPARGLTLIERLAEAQPAAKIFADVHYADWLVWHDPHLAGRIAYDTSFENLTTQQLTALNSLGQASLPGMPDPVAPYSVLVLEPSNRITNRILLRRTGSHVLLKNKRVIVAMKAPR